MMRGAVLGVPSLFEAGEHQPRPLALVDRGGLPCISLRLGSVVTHQLVQELNDLIGNRYHDSAVEALSSADDSRWPPNAP